MTEFEWSKQSASRWVSDSHPGWLIEWHRDEFRVWRGNRWQVTLRSLAEAIDYVDRAEA